VEMNQHPEKEIPETGGSFKADIGMKKIGEG
jgi:hypothetical protein